MFVGHYGPALVARRFAPGVSLFWFFIAAQFVDILFFLFVLAGIEQVRIVPGWTASNALELVYMPYTHSLVGTLVWGVVAAAAGYFWLFRNATAGRLLGSVLFGLVTISHFFLDLPMHTPDLPVFRDSGTKLGFGLWNYLWLSVGLEMAAFGIGFLFFWKSLRLPLNSAQRNRVISFVAVFAIVALIQPFFPPPPNTLVLAIQALFFYGAFAAFAGWLEKKLQPTG